MTTPMTATEYRAMAGQLCLSISGTRVLAALEEREALLGEREQTLSWNKIATKTINDGTEEICGLRRRVAELETLLAMAQVNYSADTRDAEVGALVAKIQRHPKSVAPVVHDGYGLDVFTGALSADGFRSILSHLDSLLPKEPEVAPSGWTYERADKFVRQIDHEGGTLVVRRADSDAVPPCDREFVAKLMEASRGN